MLTKPIQIIYKDGTVRTVPFALRVYGSKVNGIRPVKILVPAIEVGCLLTPVYERFMHDLHMVLHPLHNRGISTY